MPPFLSSPRFRSARTRSEQAECLAAVVDGADFPMRRL